MATVRMTAVLRQDILNNIQKMFHSRHTKMMETVKLQTQELSKEIQEYFFPKDTVGELCKEKYRGYIKTTDRISFYVESHGKTFAFELKFIGGKLPVKFDPSSYYMNDHHYVLDVEATTLYPKVQSILQPLHQIESDRQTLINQIEELLQKVPSLKKLIEVWPSALDFVSPHFVQQHNKVVKYTREPKVEIAMDIETKANLLKARMGDV